MRERERDRERKTNLESILSYHGKRPKRPNTEILFNTIDYIFQAVFLVRFFFFFFWKLCCGDLRYTAVPSRRWVCIASSRSANRTRLYIFVCFGDQYRLVRVPYRFAVVGNFFPPSRVSRSAKSAECMDEHPTYTRAASPVDATQYIKLMDENQSSGRTEYRVCSCVSFDCWMPCIYSESGEPEIATRCQVGHTYFFEGRLWDEYVRKKKINNNAREINRNTFDSICRLNGPFFIFNYFVFLHVSYPFSK